MKTHNSLSIEYSDLENIFPFYIFIDRNYKIVRLGRSMKKILVADYINSNFLEHWQIIRPMVDIELENIFSIFENKLIVICPKSDKSLKFKGQLIRINKRNDFVFIGTPVFNSSDEVIKHGLDFNDFALHDSMLDLFQVLKNNEIANSELKEIVTKISSQRKILSVSEEKYRSIIANMNLGLLEVDNDEIIQYANQSFCNMSGYELNEIINKKAADLFVKGENQKVLNQKISLREKGISDAYEIVTQNKGGEIKCWLVSGAPRYNSEGKVIGSIGIHLDITNQKEIENQLISARELAEQSAYAKESFLANMSHEIRTPLNGIIGMIRELSKENLTKRQQTYVDSAQKASKHLLSIINNILDFSKIEAGELKLSQNHFSLQDEILDVVKILSNQAQKKNISLLILNEERLADAFVGDSLRIRQILLNIIGNSIKFSDHGKIEIETAIIQDNKYHQEFRLRISDHGIGMSETYVKNIFTKFQQEDISSSRKYGGSGLGLVITKELIDLMNGKIQIKSKKGIGTEITILLTLPKGNIEQIQKVEMISSKEFVNNKRILLVEDNEMNRLVAINALEPYNFKIVEAENGQIAIEILKNNLFDLILMDLQMPVMGGFEATKIIRHELKITTPIIALTANAFKLEIDKCIELGMNNYIIKPFEEIELIEAISQAIGHNKNETSYGYYFETKMPQTDLYNLDKLKEMSRGNNDFIKKMLNIFVETVTDSITEMKDALSNSDFDTVKKIAHKLKPSGYDLGLNIKAESRNLEKFEVHAATKNVFIEHTYFVMNMLSNVLKSIKENELR